MVPLTPVLLLLLVEGGSAGSRLEVITEPVTLARLGAGALLPCRFEVKGPVVLPSLRVTWYFWSEPIAWYEHGQNQTQPGPSLPSETELLSGNVSLSLRAVTVSDGGQYTCVVGYDTHQRRGNTTLRVLAAPTISVYKQLAVGRAETALLCHVGQFFPEDVDVAWLRDGQVLDGSTRTRPQRNPDGTFNLTLTYTFTPVRGDAGTIFSCRARHPALGQPLVEDVPPDSTGVDLRSAVAGAVIVGVGTVTAAAAFYCWTQRRGTGTSHLPEH